MHVDHRRDLLTAYWIKAPSSVPLYFGVSAYSPADAFSLLQREGYQIDSQEAALTENIAVADLDQDHVVPNMGVITRRGVWYPNHNSSP